MLGSRKLLIVLCIVPCVLSLVCVGAFAAPADDLTPSVDIPFETEVVNDVVKSPSVVVEETFPAQPLLESSFYKYTFIFVNLPNSEGTALTNVYQISFSANSGQYLFGRSFEDGASVWRGTYGDSSTTVFWGSGQFDNYTFSSDTPGYVNSLITVTVLSASPTQTIGGNTVSGTLVEESLIPELADSVFDLGDALISFVVSSWVVMIPLAAWLVVLCIVAIRKLVKGV